MNKRIQGMVVGFLAALILTGSAFAATGTKTLQAVYRDIKIVIDGNAVTPKDAGGNTVEPFVVDGTTYLPVRAVAEALGKAVEWDGNTNTVYIGNKNNSNTSVVKLTALDFIAEGGINGGLNYGFQKVSQGHTNTDEYIEDALESIAEFGQLPRGMYRDYTLNKQYSSIGGAFYLRYDEKATAFKIILKIYGDGKLLYQSNELGAGVAPIQFKVNVSDVTTMKIAIEPTDGNGTVNFGLGNVTLQVK